MFNIFYADCIGREGNCLYPHKADVTDAASLAQAVAHDYVCAEYKNSYRSNANPKAGEERLISAISEIDILRERYRQAVEYMDWFKPAWEQLTDDERYCLETFYGDGNTYGSSAAYYIAEYLHVEQPTAYKRKNRALDRLTILLFGKS